MTKRSRTAALAIVGAASFALAGCREDPVDARAFPDLQSCQASVGPDSLFSRQDCETAFAEAQTLHAETAPRYDSREVCEEQYGAGNCDTEAQATGGGSGSIFMPLIAGYLIGNMLGGRGIGAQPMYRGADGRFTTPGGGTSYANNTGRAKLTPQAFAKAPVTAGKPPMSRATAASRGGFGTRSTGTGLRGFGG
ncbi:hypothetical protein AL036_05400 [Salipiger aestuarii]|uniref:Uncharacterized protein YgiB involved in biofilm formation n=1 Tax=Salipiger aestuarii TaxID=568098 RepID=A0A327YIP9_9RHOB|nr:DUF1190 domain-containing protein [Salipiger aestuarii]KAA8608851.1 hypothetical protein AL036_05400 [Salipiger aestuarii]KAA8613156.1 hypothetical protein AL037_05370 [Salipiger aestuarii]KAB2542988.1 hypothetical protein AL035_03770 [Salipiger aestuarii]RAK19635.1 uncharacterized protein YgiB involved in biofilm formation [Salipiger aestuarii]